MVPGVSGSLISGDFAGRLLRARFQGQLGERERRGAEARLQRWWRSVEACCGPATSVRLLVDAAARPLGETLGFRIERADAAAPELWVLALTRETVRVPLVVVPWDAPPRGVWRAAVRSGLLYQAPWCLVFNGHRIRLVDADRLHTRRHVEFELPVALEHAPAFEILWALLRPAAFQADGSGTDLVRRIARASESEGLRVCADLRTGVRTGLEHLLTALVRDQRGSRPRAALDVLHDEALTAIYRVLFLLFAEARRLVPTWHPVYRRAYSVETLRLAALREGSTPGVWEALQAIGRLAHAGCRAGDLKVTPFNGRLFSPARAPRLDHARLDDAAVRDALLAVSTIDSRDEGRRHIAFQDLGVEELGAVYEALLEFEPCVDVRPEPRVTRNAAAEASVPRGSGDPAVRLERSGTARRKATGTFYTPRPLTRFLIAQTLDPLIAGRTADQLLALRVCDPAMGSGAFLVAACRHLARAYEAALIAAGTCRFDDLDARDRAGFRRLVARRCLFGVDLNPMAVQLARLSLWLATLAADHPLTFLDHHLACGDSLIGAGPADLLRGAEPVRAGDRQLPLFDPSRIAAVLAIVLPVRHHLEDADDLTAAAVHEKEAALEGLERRADLARWRAACTAWCDNWCRDRPAPASTLRALIDAALHDRSALSAGVLASERQAAAQAAGRLRFFHWPLQFPEVFFDERGGPRSDAGFDAIVGNPPWEMLREDEGGAGDRMAARACARFARRSGLYTARSTSHANQYQLFVERALALTRPGGRIGVVVPAGLAIDAGAAPLRRRLMHECALESLVGFENRAGLFPIHRSTRFLLLTASKGGVTRETRCWFGLQDPAALDDLQDRAVQDPASAYPVRVSPPLLQRLAGPDVPIPYAATMRDLVIAETLAARHPRLADARGWHASFGRELNATDHRRAFTTGGRGLPVLEGKHVAPYRADAGGATRWIAPERAARLLGSDRAFTRPRLAFRDVSSAANRQTVIAAIVPAGCVTTHTLFCLRTRLPLADQRVLCALLNSHALDFLVRQRVSTHVTIAVMRTIPVPRPAPGSTIHSALERRVRMLEEGALAPDEAAPGLQALAAAAFELSRDEFAHVLSTFPLVPEEDRQRALDAFTRPGCR